MKMYKTTGWSNGTISEVEVSRKTDAFIVVHEEGRGGMRRAIRSHDINYFETFEDARKHLMDVAQNDIDSARAALQRGHDKLGKAKGLKPPKVTT